MDELVRDFLMIYYSLMIPLIIGIYLFMQYGFIRWYLYLNPWIKEAKTSDFTGLRFFKRIYYFSTVIEENTFSKAWKKYNLLSFLWSAFLFWAILPYLVFAIEDIESNSPLVVGVGLALLFIFPILLIHIVITKELEPFYKKGKQIASP